MQANDGFLRSDATRFALVRFDIPLKKSRREFFERGHLLRRSSLLLGFPHLDERAFPLLRPPQRSCLPWKRRLSPFPQLAAVREENADVYLPDVVLAIACP